MWSANYQFSCHWTSKVSGPSYHFTSIILKGCAVIFQFFASDMMPKNVVRKGCWVCWAMLSWQSIHWSVASSKWHCLTRTQNKDWYQFLGRDRTYLNASLQIFAISGLIPGSAWHFPRHLHIMSVCISTSFIG